MEVRSAYVGWFQELPVQLWLTVNAKEPLWPGSWRFVLDQVLELIETEAGERGQTAWCGVCETNRDREGFHLHALGLGSDALRHPRRVGADGLVPQIASLVEPLHASYRDYVREDNAAAVQLKAVQRYGKGLRSLHAYFTKTLHAYMRKDVDADWFDVGDVGRFLSTSVVTLSA